MRLGTKILLLTLAITLSLAGIIVWVVTRDVAGHETQRAQADIARAVSAYFERIAALHEREIELVLESVMEEPANVGQLELLDAGDEAAREHFRSYLLGEVVQKKVKARPPTFQVVVNFEGKPLVAAAPGEPKLAEALARELVTWPYEPILDETDVHPRRYVWVNDGLYLALGRPLRLETSGPPTHAYFIGYRIDDDWARFLLDTSSDNERAEEGGAQAAAWFVVDGRVIARGSTSADLAAAASDGAVANIATAGAADVRRPIAFDAGGERFVGEAVAFELPGGRRGALAVASSLTRALERLRHLQAIIAWVTVGVVVVAVVAFRYVSNLIARPVRQLVAGTRRVAKGEFDEPIVVNRSDELGELAASFNEMAVGLRQRDLVKSTFGKFVDPKVVEGFLADPSRLMPGGDKRVQSVLFSDLAGFTTFSERLDPDDLVALLNEHLGDAAEIVAEMRGIVDKFIGDATVAFWGLPITRADEHAGLACVAALRIVRAIRRLDEQCARLGVPPLSVRVGVATGEVLVGIIGSANKYNYTVMGDTANLGSRLEGLNKTYGTNVLVSARTAAEAAHAVLTRRIDRVRVVGRAEPVEIHEVLAERGQENGVFSLRREAYAQAMSRYERRMWAEAGAAFERMTREWPNDGAARMMLTRCAAFQQSDPGPEWDGVWNATSK